MKQLALLTVVAAALLTASAGGASAQIYYNGPGFGAHIGPVYDDGYRRAPRYERYREYQGRRYYSRNGCPRGYTVQDGVCKPYRGY